MAPVSTELKYIIALSHFPNAMKEDEEEEEEKKEQIYENANTSNSKSYHKIEIK